MGRPKGFERNDVLDKSIQLFWKKGYSGTCLQDLEKATGVNKSGLYSEFKDKDDLFIQSLKRYAEESGVLELLYKEPLGRANLENFLLMSQRCSGQKGCFMSYTIRELSILPAAARAEIQKHTDLIRAALIKNIAACSSNKDEALLADLLLTFNSGLALKLNLGQVPNMEPQAKRFLDALLA